MKNLLENIEKDINEKIADSGVRMESQKMNSFRKKDQEAHDIKPTPYKEIKEVEGHQDGVRDILFLDKNKLMVSGSEDCTLKVWNVANPSATSCLGTIREHSGPIFTVIECEGCVLTGGMEGVIRCWDFRNVAEKKDVNRKNLIGVWNNSEEDKLEPIWQLVYSPEHVTMLL